MDTPGQKKLGIALLWKLLERFGFQGVQFVLQIVLARILDPSHYGVLSLMVIFTTLANVFIQSGFSTALVRGKDVDQRDYSSVFWASLGIAVALYGVIYAAVPLIAQYYNMPDIVNPMRVLALMLIPGAFNSVQLAKVSREMNFRKVFVSNLAGIIISGAVSIIMALNGAGLWALVVQTLANVTVACVVMFFTVKWRPAFVCDFNRLRVLLSFGWKILVSNLIDTLYQDIRSLVIGKKYNSETLGFYNRGKNFPQFIITAVNSTVQSVMLPAMAAKQDDHSAVKQLTRNSIMLSAYILFPLMAGLAGVANTMVEFLLTEKWLPCVPYLQIYCFALAFNPIHSCNLQAINAMGRSDIFLKLEIIKKVIGILALVIAVFCFDSPVAIALTGVFTAVTSCFINAYPNKKLIGYSYLDQMRDILPSMLLSVLMLVIILLVALLPLPVIAMLVVQFLVGVVAYIALSAWFRITPFLMLVDYIKKKKK